MERSRGECVLHDMWWGGRIWSYLTSFCNVLLQMISDYVGLYNYSQFSKEEKRGALLRVFFGILLTLILHCNYTSVLVQGIFNGTLDWYVQCATWLHKELGGNDASKDECVFFDFDDESWKNLGSPYWTPRGVIAGMIQHAKENGAAVIIVDWYFEDWWPDWYECKDDKRTDEDKKLMGNVSGRNGDKKLIEVLKTIGKKNDKNIPVLLARGTYSDGQLMPTFLTKEIAEDFKEKYPNLHWVSPDFPKNDAEGIVRKLPDSCNKAELPRIGTLAAAMKSLGNAGEEAIKEKLEEYDKKKNDGNPVPRICFFYEEENAHTISKEAAPYILHWRKKETGKAEKIERNGEEMGYMVWSNSSGKDKSYEGKIVIIGGSDHNGVDFHKTVIDDEMPGMYIHGNIIATLLRGEPPCLLEDLEIGGGKVSQQLIWDILLILLLSFPLAQLEQKSVTVFVALPCLLLVVLFGVFYFTNIYIFIGIPVCILGLFEVVADIKEILRDIIAYVQTCVNG